jgi:phage terminase Nu1 subunit (DNA packaging protein)
MTVRLNRAEVARHMGVTPPTIDRWIKDGMPVVQRGSRGVEWVFDLPEVIRWWGDRREKLALGDAPTDLDEIQKRTATARMLQAELELAKAMGQVAPLDQMERNLSKLFAELRANMRNIPGNIVTQLIGETDERRFKQVLLQEIDQALEAMANADLAADDDDGEDDESSD